MSKVNNDEHFFLWFFATICMICLSCAIVIRLIESHHMAIYNHAYNNEVNQFEESRWYSSSSDHLSKLKSLSHIAIQSKLSECVIDLNQALDEYSSVLISKKYKFIHLNKVALKKALDENEMMCSRQMIQNLAIANDKKASALIYYLLQKGTLIPDEYKRFSKKDDIALANIHWNTSQD